VPVAMLFPVGWIGHRASPSHVRELTESEEQVGGVSRKIRKHKRPIPVT
jgi:hypothetical protein